MKKSEYFGLMLMIVVSPRMSTNFALGLGALYLVCLLVASVIGE